MPQWAALPTSPTSDLQRGSYAFVPCMFTRCGSRCSVSADGTMPPARSVSIQWKATRNVAQHAPQRRQGWVIRRLSQIEPEKVLHLPMSPDSRPVLNHFTRCAEV